MPFDLQLDLNAGRPRYRQVVERITHLVRAGSLRPGDRLPPERELASQLGIARGTISKAYEELARNGVVDVATGRGSFVSARQDTVPTSRKARALDTINRLLDELTGLQFSYHEIRNMVDLLSLVREEQLENLKIAVVDCSPEALSMLYRQLWILSRIDGAVFLLDDIVSSSEPENRLSGFDLILTTATHYSELSGAASRLIDRMVRIVASPSQETIIHLAGLKDSQTIGILCESRSFLTIIKLKLEDLRFSNVIGHLFWPCEAEQLAEFIAQRDVLIVPPVFSTLRNRETAPILTSFTERGGQIIPFDYQIERGSLVYLEERIKNLKGR
jgi:DNA-binding transcriptional regulator YhcF (GntR family)